jgi:hypothetical protein
MNLSVLEGRLLDRLPEDFEKAVQQEFSRFETEIEAMSPDRDKIGQARLTDDEIARLPTGNQHSDDPTIIEWQCVKAAAIHYGVRDWTAKADSTLTHEENVSLMEQYGTENNETTVREMAHTIR